MYVNFKKKFPGNGLEISQSLSRHHSRESELEKFTPGDGSGEKEKCRSGL